MSGQSWFAEGIKGRHVLMALIAFFGAMLIANGIFVYFAVATFSGGDTSNAYRKGLDYNETLAAAERQAARGWQTDIAYDDKAGWLVLSVHDKTAAPITGLSLAAVLSRPATDQQDQRIVLTETSQGVYAADIEIDPGLWVISLASREQSGASEPVYRLKRRLFVAERP
jgi:nitrogen fixation protein FixH